MVNVATQYPRRAQIMAKPKMIRRMRMICRVLAGMLVVLRATGAIVVD